MTNGVLNSHKKKKPLFRIAFKTYDDEIPPSRTSYARTGEAMTIERAS
jgi:hypothetical protein